MENSRLLMIDLAGQALTADERALLSEHPVGGICFFSRNFRDRFQMAELSLELRELCGDDLLLAVDQEGGAVLRTLDVPYSPGNMALGAGDRPELTRAVAAATARGLKAMGININFAPNADVNNNPHNPVIGDRSFGADPQLVARHVVAFVQGLQQEGVAATLKHFPGHGDTATDSHLDLPRLEYPLSRLETIELVPFRAGIAAGSAAVMSYHGVVTALDPSRPATLSRRVMTDFLRNELGFDGVSFTDALEMQAIAKTYSPAESVIQALAAGVDMPLYDVHTASVKTHETILLEIAKAVLEGRLDAANVRRKLERIDRLAKRYRVRAQPEAAWQENDSPLMSQAATAAVTVLGDFRPLKPGMKVALVTASNLVGGAASDVIRTPATSLAEMLESRGIALRYISYDRANCEHEHEQERILAEITAAELVLFVSVSRTRMMAEEIAMVRKLASVTSAFVHLALWNPYQVLDIPGPAVVTFGFRDVSVQAALEVLLGEEPQGRLPIPLTPLT